MQHEQYGKMAEVTQHWDIARHPAFKKPSVKPKTADALLSNSAARISPSLWVASEKIHGSNASFVVTPNTGPPAAAAASPVIVRCAKREDFLDDSADADNESFFGYRRVKARHDAHAAMAFARIAALIAESGAAGINEKLAVKAELGGGLGSSLQLDRLTIYGELFGGGFPSLPLLVADPSVSLVQDGLFYSNDLHFCCFDMALTVSAASATAAAAAAAASTTTSTITAQQSSKTFYCDFLPAMQLLSSCGFMVAQPLLIGSYEDMNAFPIEFKTTVPGLLGVPKAAQEKLVSNFAEGIVCRTNVTQFVPVASKSQQGQQEQQQQQQYHRTIFKRKVTKFAAVCDQRTAQLKAAAQADTATALLDVVREQILTPELLQSAVSKTGKPVGAAKGKILSRICRLLLEDVREQIEINAAMIAQQQAPPQAQGKRGKAAAAAAASSKGVGDVTSFLLNQNAVAIESMVQEFVTKSFN